MSPEPPVTAARVTRQRSGEVAGNYAWRWVGWFGLVLTMAGLGDFILTWFPLDLGSAEWEFGTIAASFSGLPLVTIGFAGLLGSALARGSGWQLAVVGVFLLAVALVLVGAMVLFGLVVPVALAAVEGAGRLGIMKAIIRTTLLGIVFSVAYLAAGIGALRHARKS
jgi:predicted anti-sigma-YlaC factor YlaD